VVTVATWNVNGVRARLADVEAWLSDRQPDLVCLQELKAEPDQVPAPLRAHADYWSVWHGHKGYSGVALMVRKAMIAESPRWHVPSCDFETRIVTAQVPIGSHLVTLASVYVPNGGKDYEAKLRFLNDLHVWVAETRRQVGPVLLCGDLNVAHTDRDIHPRERRPQQIGTRSDERALIETLLAEQLVDVGRSLDPDNDALFTWWPPWRQMKQRNIGWRIDYVLASQELAGLATGSEVLRDTGSSDHGPLVVTLAPAVSTASLVAGATS
jgi:exodeoxyribonuclease-3